MQCLFCYVFRDILDNPKYGNVKEGYDAWKEYVESFGFGRKLGSDFLDERDGYVPDRAGTTASTAGRGIR